MKPVYETGVMETKQLVKNLAGTKCQYLTIYPISANIFIFMIHQIVFSSTLLTMLWIYYIKWGLLPKQYVYYGKIIVYNTEFVILHVNIKDSFPLIHTCNNNILFFIKIYYYYYCINTGFEKFILKSCGSCWNIAHCHTGPYETA